MKKLFSIFLIALFAFAGAQESKETANRFFYELTFKPKKDSTKLDKVITILDITPKKSIYQDYTMPAQDSIIKVQVEEMEKTKSFKDMSKMIRWPKFSYKIVKNYPDMKLQYVDKISRNFFSYDDNVKLQWNILQEKQKIGTYNTQKATTEFGGRTWTAWFSSDIPFQDGPYKFYGLPGLIVKVEDADKNYSWLLSGNKKIDNYDEISYADKINAKMGMSSNTVTPTTKEKFQKSFDAFKADPFAESRPYMTAETMSKPMPGTNGTIGDFMKRMEKQVKDFFGANDNPIEKDQASDKKKK
ncbi:GLPGLI family protein [Chryseobacterium sp. HMWF028]|nr:GLPGLI family protein [Chryseobacterium sp. HMWF028]